MYADSAVSEITPALYRAGSGEPLLLLHGFTGAWGHWRPVLEGLSERYEVIAPTLAGHDGVEYRSPPLPREDALALVRVLLGDDRTAAETRSWRCPIAGGQRTVTLEPAPGIGANANGRQPANGARRSTPACT